MRDTADFGIHGVMLVKSLQLPLCGHDLKKKSLTVRVVTKKK